MATESATYIDGLDSSKPAGTESPAEGDDHLRLIKSTIKATFPNLTGAVNATQAELNLIDGSVAGTVVAGKAAVYSSASQLHASYFAVPKTGTIGSNLIYDTADARWEHVGNGYGFAVNDNGTTGFDFSTATENSSGAGAAATRTVRMILSYGGDLEITGDQIGINNTQTPASAGATGVKGTICWDADYIYVCTATNTWKRAAIATWT